MIDYQVNMIDVKTVQKKKKKKTFSDQKHNTKHRRIQVGVQRERAHPVGLRQKQSNQPVFLANFYLISSFSNQ